MFVNEDYADYKYLLYASDNFVALTDQHRVMGESGDPDSVSVIYQYIKPSYLTLEDTLDLEYTKTLTEIDTTSDFTSRSDFIDINFGGALVVVLVLVIFRTITKVFVSGGVR